jgi:hypothetical protein
MLDSFKESTVYLSLLSRLPRWLLVTILILASLIGFGLLATGTQRLLQGEIHYEKTDDGKVIVEYWGR